MEIVRALRKQCCESCGNIEWKITGGNVEFATISNTDKGNAWVEKLTDRIPTQTRSMVFII